MNNIEILEDYLKFIEQFDNNSAFIPAIENLIKENKELKEEVLYWKGKYHLENRKYIQLHNEKIDAPVIEATEEMLKLYIAKSKVKEKIEEYNDILDYAETEEGMAELKDYEYDEAKYGRKVLKELLEGE